MGFSYGYNRAERLEHYHTGRELVIMLVDLVSRGGNLLLDIGPAADGTIPVVMEQRLIEIGTWLKVNGDAIYGTKPWKTSRQWSAGEVPKVEYNKEYEAAYDVTKLAAKPAAGKAGDRSLFHRQGKERVRDHAALAGPPLHAEGRFAAAEVGDTARLGSATALEGTGQFDQRRVARRARGTDATADVGAASGPVNGHAGAAAGTGSSDVPGLIMSDVCIGGARGRIGIRREHGDEAPSAGSR